jgi:hypothetical protein
MKIKVKSKVVVRVLIIYWSCFFILWFFFKKLPEMREDKAIKVSIQNYDSKLFYESKGRIITTNNSIDLITNILV